MLLSKLGNRVLSTLYPETCAACDTPLLHCQGLCELCLQSSEAISIACPTCAKPLSGSRAISCADCQQKTPDITSCTAVYEYGGQLAVALKRLKFSKQSNIARSLRPLLQEPFAKAASGCDFAVPVPLHPRRLAKRGFNQAQRLLVPLASKTHLKLARNLLIRTRNTPAQARLNAQDRASNLRDAFAMRGEVAGSKILLVDDIRTTGSTLGAAALALKSAGASEVHCFVVARAQWRRS